MATESPRGKKVFFSYVEAVAGTPDTNCFFEGGGQFMTKPSITPTQESDQGKMGAGEYGTRAETQAYWTEFTYTFQRLSEIGYFANFAMGRADVPVTATGDGEAHISQVLLAASRILPTFTIEYGVGSANTVCSHCIINEFSLSASRGGTGVVEGSISGFCNTHTVAAGVFALNSTGSMATGVNDLTAEPLVNYRAFEAWIGAGLAAPINTADDFDFEATNLTATPTEITALLDGFTLRVNNGLTVDQLARPGGNGILSDQNRADPNIEFELLLRKDIAVYNPYTVLLADTQNSIELLFRNVEISAGEPYALNIILPYTQIIANDENDETPTSYTLPCEVHQDSSGDPLLIGVQNKIAIGFNVAFV